MLYNNISNLLLAATLLVTSATASIYLLVKYLRRVRLRTGDPPVRLAEREAQLLKTQLELQEQAFQHISQEIHDNIGQALTFVKLNMHSIDLRKPEETRDKLYESQALITKAIQDLRYIAKSLNTDFISEAGLTACIENQLHFLEKTGLYTTHLDICEDWVKASPETELVLFRVVQELLHNIVKHAGATHIEINLHCFPQHLQVMVSDNGKGFLPAATVYNGTEKGLGLGNMDKRLAAVQGKLIIHSTPGEGTTVYIEVPLKRVESRNMANESKGMYNYATA